MKKKNAQSAIEFVILTGAVLFFMLGLLGVFQKNIAQESREKRDDIIHSLALEIQNELSIAAQATDGYQRQFSIPEKIAGKDYDIGIYARNIYLNTTDGKHALALPVQNSTGQLQKGTNTIRKINSTIFLN